MLPSRPPKLRYHKIVLRPRQWRVETESRCRPVRKTPKIDLQDSFSCENIHKTPMKCPLQSPHVLYLCIYKFTMRYNNLQELQRWILCVGISHCFLWADKYKHQGAEVSFNIFIIPTHITIFCFKHQVFWVTCLPLETIFKYSMWQTTMMSLQLWPWLVSK